MRTEEVEAVLRRLMPASLSQRGSCALDDLIDELSGESEGQQEPPTVVKKPLWKIFGGIAAGVLACVGGVSFLNQRSVPPVAEGLGAAQLPEFVLVSESDRISSVQDEGWSEEEDGSTGHAVRLTVIEENRWMDSETGIVVRISEPREEIFYTPIRSF